MGSFVGTKKCIVCGTKLLVGKCFWTGHIHTKSREVTAGFCGAGCLATAEGQTGIEGKCTAGGCFGRSK